MNSEQFTYWLNGFVEMNPSAMISPSQWEMLKQHLALVFNKVTPKLSTTQPFPVPTIDIPPKVGVGVGPLLGIDKRWTDPYQITC